MRCTKHPISLSKLCVCVALDFIRHPERSEAESNFFVLDPKRHCVPFAPHCVRSSTALRMTQTKKCRAKQGRIYKEVTHIVRYCLSAQPTALRIFHSFASSSSTALSLSIFFISHTIDITLSLNLTLVGRRFIIRFS